jgi:thiamine-phosphate pyrophosphorylase
MSFGCLAIVESVRFPSAVYPILDADTLQRLGCPVLDAAQAMLDAGVGILQFRHKEHWTRDTFTLATRIADLCRARRALLILNDRADYAKLLGAGLHLGQDDLPPRAARDLLGPDAIIGFSTHNEAQLLAAAEEPVDYLALGPFFGTSSKRNADPTVGVDNLSAWRKQIRQPLVAIGGITRANASQVLTAGADAVAVISDLYPALCDPDSVRERMAEWLRLKRT